MCVFVFIQIDFEGNKLNCVPNEIWELFFQNDPYNFIGVQMSKEIYQSPQNICQLICRFWLCKFILSLLFFFIATNNDRNCMVSVIKPSEKVLGISFERDECSFTKSKFTHKRKGIFPSYDFYRHIFVHIYLMH